MHIAKALTLAAAVAVGAIGAVSISAAVAQTANVPFLVIDTAKLSNDAPAFADMQAKVEALVQQKQNEFATQNRAAAEAVAAEGRTLEPLVQGKTEAQLTPDLRAKLEQFRKRQQDLAVKKRLLDLSTQATAQRAQVQIVNLLDPILGQIMTQRNASAVIDRSSVLKVNPALDITQDATARFNAAHPKAPQPTWASVTFAPPEGAAAPVTIAPGAPKKK
jgi:outer membrane protein